MPVFYFMFLGSRDSQWLFSYAYNRYSLCCVVILSFLCSFFSIDVILFLVIFFLIEIWLIYNVTLVSGVQQSDSVIYIFFFRLFSIIGYYEILNTVPCALRQVLVGFLFYIQQWVFLGGSDCKESACDAGDLGSVPGWGRSPGQGNGNPLQY